MNNSEKIQDWMEKVKEIFPKSTSVGSLRHLLREIQETIDEIDSDDPSPLQDEGIPLMEYADCILCILSSASFAGFTSEQIFKAVNNKIDINYKRSWKYNGDNTYSHI